MMARLFSSVIVRRSEGAERDHRGERLDAIGATAVQVLGNMGDISFAGCGVEQFVNGALGHSSAMDELDFGARVEQVDTGEFAMSSGEMRKDPKVRLDVVAADLENLAADINPARQNAERLELQPEQAAVTASVGRAFASAVVLVDLDGKLLREASVDAGLGHAGQLADRDALADDERQLVLVVRTSVAGRANEGVRGAGNAIIVGGGWDFCEAHDFYSPLKER